jgi:plastocyanin
MRFFSAIFAMVLMTIGTISSRAATQFVRMNNFTFTPQNLTVEVGDTVTWTNEVITGHDTTCQGVWASPLLARRQTFSFTFTTPGTFNYICTPHVSFGMTGRITVRAPVNNPPTATITSPQNGQAFQVGETINVNVNATDDNGVAKVDLFLDGGSQQTDTTSPYEFSLNKLPAGNHTLVARATDAGGLTGESSITVNVQFANAAPTATLTSPTNTARFTEPATVVFSADVTGSVERVEFLTNGVVMAIDTTAPYSVTNNLTKGAYTIVARAVGADTQVGTSAPADIEVGEHIPEPPKVSITAPLDGDFFTFGSNIVLRAEATDDDSPIAQITLNTSSSVIATLPNVNQIELLTTFPEGVQTVFATATDTTGLISTSAPVTFTMQMAATNVYRTNIAPGVLRLGFFGSSGLPYVFEYTTNAGATWTPVRTNALYRRIFYFDDLVPTNEPVVRMYRARSPRTSTQP